MPIWLHILLEMILAGASLMAWWGLIAVVWLLPAVKRLLPEEPAASILLLLACTPGFGIAWLLERWFQSLPARCPQCGGEAFVEGNRPVRFHCRSCGFRKITRAWRKGGAE